MLQCNNRAKAFGLINLFYLCAEKRYAKKRKEVLLLKHTRLVWGFYLMKQVHNKKYKLWH